MNSSQYTVVSADLAYEWERHLVDREPLFAVIRYHDVMIAAIYACRRRWQMLWQSCYRVDVMVGRSYTVYARYGGLDDIIMRIIVDHGMKNKHGITHQ